jgi:hypothetical protein
VKPAAQAISLIFHPLLLTTYLVILLGIYFPAMLMIESSKLWMIVAFVFVFTFLMPALNLLMLRAFKTIQSLTLHSRQERLFPFTLIAFIYALVAFLFYYKLHFSTNFNKLILIIFFLVLISLMITFFYKISIHSLAMAGGVGILVPLNKALDEPTLLIPTVALILVMGLVMSARLALGAHTLREVIHGGMVGFVVGFGGIVILF